MATSQANCLLEVCVPSKRAAKKRPYCPPQLYRLTAVEVIRKAIRIAEAQDASGLSAEKRQDYLESDDDDSEALSRTSNSTARVALPRAARRVRYPTRSR